MVSSLSYLMQWNGLGFFFFLNEIGMRLGSNGKKELEVSDSIPISTGGQEFYFKGIF